MTDQLVHIVVGDDFSDPGRLAIREALRRARNAHLHVTHVVTEKEVRKAKGDNETERMNAAMEGVPEKIWDRVREIGGEVVGLETGSVSVHVRVGEPTDGLNQVAADYNADLIIVGTRDEKGLKSLGSVATHLIHHASCPVLVARPRNYAGVSKSERPDPPRPGEELHENRAGAGYHGTQRVSWNPSAKASWRMY
jgi:nucleotide-binding universal stress UspA family protein